MRLPRLFILFLLSIQLNFIFHNPLGDTFVTIPAWVAFGAITTAVKLKLILVKIMFALKTMGIGSIRIKRSNTQRSDDELVVAWRDLEATLGRNIQFILDSCIAGATSELKTSQITTDARNKPTLDRPMTSRDQLERYAIFVSSTIGSMTRSISGCHFLEDALYGPGVNPETGT